MRRCGVFVKHENLPVSQFFQIMEIFLSKFNESKVEFMIENEIIEL